MKYVLLLMIFFMAQTHAAIIFHQNFEDGKEGNTSGFHPTNEHCCDHSIQNVTSKSHDGNRSLRTVIYANDEAVIKTHTARANLMSESGAVIDGVPVMPFRKDRWFGMSVYVPKNDGMGDNNIFNVHAHNWGEGCGIFSASSPISFQIFGPARLWNSYGHEWVLYAMKNGK